MPVSYNSPRNGEKFAIGYAFKIGEQGTAIEFTEAIAFKQSPFFWIVGFCEGWDIVNYDDRAFSFSPQLFAIRFVCEPYEKTWEGSTQKKEPSYCEMATFDYLEKASLWDTPLKLEINFGPKGSRGAEYLCKDKSGERELTDKGRIEFLDDFLPTRAETSLTKFSVEDYEAFKEARLQQSSRRSQGGFKGGSYRSLGDRISALWEASKMEGEPNLLELYAFFDELSPETLRVLTELLRIS